MTLESDQAGKEQAAREASNSDLPWPPSHVVSWGVVYPTKPGCTLSTLIPHAEPLLSLGSISEAPGSRISYRDMTLCSVTRIVCLTLGHGAGNRPVLKASVGHKKETHHIHH